MQISEILSCIPRKITCRFAVGELETYINLIAGQFVKVVVTNSIKEYALRGF